MAVIVAGRPLFIASVADERRKMQSMSGKRDRTNELKVFLSDDEKYVLDNKVKASGMRNKSEYIRHMILYNYTYDIDYKDLQEYSRQISAIGRTLTLSVSGL